MKRQLTNREKILLMVFAVCLTAAALYYIVIIPQLEMVNQLQKKAEYYNQTIADIKAKASLENPVYNEYNKLNQKTADLLRKYYPEIIQEKLILMLDEKAKASNIRLVSANFTEPSLKELNKLEEQAAEQEPQINELQALIMQMYNEKLGVKEEKPTTKVQEKSEQVYRMTASLSLEGSYDQIFSFLKSIEQEKRSIVCSDININSNGSSLLLCDMKLDFYAVPKPFDQDDDYLYWDKTGVYGKTNPF